jgi:transglutaminase-like putative cysteine protease
LGSRSSSDESVDFFTSPAVSDTHCFETLGLELELENDDMSVRTRCLASIALFGPLPLLLVGCIGSSSSNENPPTPSPRPPMATVPRPTKPTPMNPKPAATSAAGFQNLDFEEVDASGVPLHWTCGCASGPIACKTDTMHPEHGKRDLVLPSGCYALQSISKFSTNEGVSFAMYANGGAVMPTDMALYGYPTADFYAEALYSDGLPTPVSQWTHFASRGSLPTDGEDELYLSLYNSNGDGDTPPGADLYVDNISVVQGGPNPPPKIGSLLKATHIDEFGLSASTSPTQIYLSLPSHWASQVPLYFDLDITPPSSVQSVTYAAEPEDNWGAVVTFGPTDGVPSVTVRWDAVALTRVIPDAELPTVFAALSPPTQWLGPSEIIESTESSIASTASGFSPSGTSPLDQMLGVIGWTSSKVTYGFNPAEPGLDATTAYDFLETTCTGYANLSSAMGRALTLPARHVTNIYVGMAQAMHSITEFYLGASQGWRRVEPQASYPRVPDDYGFIMRVVLPSDESPVANRNSPGGELMLGIPFHEFTETVSNPDAITLPATYAPTFTDCNWCPNRADPQATLRDATPDRMKAIFNSAQTAWNTTLSAYASGGLPASEIATRQRALTATSLEDVEMIVNALQ